MVASGALGFFGEGWPWDKPFIWLDQLKPALFTIVAKTVTYLPRKGNLRWYWPFGCIKFLKGGTLNAVGLRNKGYAWWLRKFRQGKGSKLSLIASIFSEADDAPLELACMAFLFNQLSIVGIEINAFCPNTPGGVFKNTKRIIRSCEEVKKVTHYPLLLKLSVVHDIDEILPNIKGIIQGISINSVPWRVIFPNRRVLLNNLAEEEFLGKLPSHLLGVL